MGNGVQMNLRGLTVLIVAIVLLGLTKAGRAQDEDPAKDALIVETLLRLDNVDLEAKPKSKAAVLRYLRANPGSEQFFQLLERFNLPEAGEVLLELAVTAPTDTQGVKAAELLVKHDDAKRLAAVIGGDDSARAAALIVALGNAGGKRVAELLEPLVTDAHHPLAVRSAAAAAIAKTKPGETYLLDLAKDKKLPADLNFTVANVLAASPLPEVREAAAKYLPLPATAGAKPLPPLAELLKMNGEAAHGKQLFETTGTCIKCHTVAGVGKDVGPNLSEIGSKLSKDAFFVAILDPSRRDQPQLRDVHCRDRRRQSDLGHPGQQDRRAGGAQGCRSDRPHAQRGGPGRFQEAAHLADARRPAKAAHGPGPGRRGGVSDDAQEAVGALAQLWPAAFNRNGPDGAAESSPGSATLG